MTSSSYPEIPIDAAIARALAAVAPNPPVEVDFEAAVGGVLAAPVRAREPMPPFAASSRDGFALRAADGGRTVIRRVVGDAVAGRGSGPRIEAGQAARITTGAPLPEGADAVVMVEQTALDGASLRIDTDLAPGENVRPVGEDYGAGDVILDAGAVIGPADVGLLASVGAVRVSIHRRPRVAVLSTGDELVDPDVTPGPGRIRDSNRFALAAAARAAGAEIIALERIGDDEADLERLAAAIERADVVLTSGGVSMGHRDRVKPWLAEHGDIVFGRVRIKPGKPATLAVVNGTPVFGLPGFPVSAFVCFELLARPVLLKMAGRSAVERPRWTVRAGQALRHAGDRVEFQRAVVALAPDGRAVAHTTGFQGSGRLLSLSGANALLRLPEGAGATPEGASVEALILGDVHAHA